MFSTARHKSCRNVFHHSSASVYNCFILNTNQRTKTRSSYILQHTRAVRTRVVCTYLEADHGEVGPHHRVKVVENVGFTQRILRLRQVTQLHRGGGKGGRGEGGGRGGGREGGKRERGRELQYSTEL